MRLRSILLASYVLILTLAAFGDAQPTSLPTLDFTPIISRSPDPNYQDLTRCQGSERFIFTVTYYPWLFEKTKIWQPFPSDYGFNTDQRFFLDCG